MKYVIVCLLLVSGAASASGYSNWSRPLQIEIEAGNGFMVVGNFGNAGNCDNDMAFYVRASHPQYEALYSAALAALRDRVLIRVYIHGCDELTVFDAESGTYNIVGPGGSLTIAR